MDAGESRHRDLQLFLVAIGSAEVDISDGEGQLLSFDCVSSRDKSKHWKRLFPFGIPGLPGRLPEFWVLRTLGKEEREAKEVKRHISRRSQLSQRGQLH
jgi:hypothetical protein